MCIILKKIIKSKILYKIRTNITEKLCWFLISVLFHNHDDSDGPKGVLGVKPPHEKNICDNFYYKIDIFIFLHIDPPHPETILCTPLTYDDMIMFYSLSNLYIYYIIYYRWFSKIISIKCIVNFFFDSIQNLPPWACV